MVKRTQTIRRQFAAELFDSVFDHFVGLAIKGLSLLIVIWTLSHHVLPFTLFL